VGRTRDREFESTPDLSTLVVQLAGRHVGLLLLSSRLSRRRWRQVSGGVGREISLFSRRLH
jgi:hypothetical protein